MTLSDALESRCQVLKWLKSPIGDSASKNEYGKRLPEVEEARALAVAKTKEKRAEPPLPYNIFHRDEVPSSPCCIAEKRKFALDWS